MNKKFFIILSIYFIVMIAANLIHPITPEFIKVKDFPDYMFGVALAMMNLTNFLFSNFWGYIIDRVGRKNIIIIGLLGYAIGQLGFGFSDNTFTLVIARLVSGFFTGAFTVPVLAYISDISKTEELKKHFSIYITLTALAGALGYYIGGVVGTNSLMNTFYLQVILLLIAAFLLFVTVKEARTFTNDINYKSLLNSLNPIQVFLNSKINSMVILMLLSSFFIYFSNTMFDNSFSYYLSKQLMQPPVVNGMIKAFTGVITLILNLTIITYLTRKYKVTNVFKNILLITLGISLLQLFSYNSEMFFTLTLLFYIVFLCGIPLQQAFIMENMDENQRGSASGLINSVRAISGVAASLIAGGIYGNLPPIKFGFINERIAYPIIISSICLVIAISIILFLIKKHHEHH